MRKLHIWAAQFVDGGRVWLQVCDSQREASEWIQTYCPQHAWNTVHVWDLCAEGES